MLLHTLSPALHVGKHSPPTFLWATAPAHAGVPFELHIFEEGMDGLSLADQASAGVQTDLNADAAQWMSLAGAWLKKRFALPLTEMPAWMLALQAAQNRASKMS